MRRLLALGALYLAQGLPFGFFTQALPVKMRAAGVSLELIGLSSLLALPWALKFLLAPTLDRAPSRRAWILPLQAASALGLFALSFAPDDAWALLLAAFFVTNLLAAAQDVATDGLAVDVLDRAQRGLGNGVQVAGYRVGMILGGGVLLVAMGALGWAVTLRLLALALALTTLPALALREPPRRPAAAAPARRALREALRRPGAATWLGLLIVYKLGDALATSMLRPMLVDRGLDVAEVGVVLGEVGFGAGLVGALLGGALVGPLGRGRALAGFAALQAVGLGGYAWLATQPDTALLHVVVGAEHLFAGMATAALFTCMMDACRADHAATDYTLQACAVVISTGVGAALAGALAATFGYAGLFTLAAFVGALAALLSTGLRRRAFASLNPGACP
ncbi:MAG: MFS transporter [Myxococcota bacterium]|nr:MFS transporter [Myxococcota bacterium]